MTPPYLNNSKKCLSSKKCIIEYRQPQEPSLWFVGLTLGFEHCFRTVSDRKNEVFNSFDVPYNNGYVKSFNNKINVVKHDSFGSRNFQDT